MENVNANESSVIYLDELDKSHFWGSVTLKYEAGRIVHIRQEQSFKPFELSERPRTNYVSKPAPTHQ
jgi:hypothetical protein